MSEPSVLHTLADLVRINSVNPAYDGGVPEAGMVDYIRRFFQRRGLETWQQEVFPGRNSSRKIILEAHTDTVSVKGMTIPPFEPAISDGRLYGRGSCDTKAGLAAMMHAVVSLKEAGQVPPCDVWLAAVVDEEFAFRGVAKLCEGLEAAAAIVAEPTELRAVIASKGVLRWRIRTRGRSAHSSKPHLGVNAVTHMARLVLALAEENRQLAQKVHPLLGPATVNVGVIHGGVQVNFVPDECVIEIDRRLLPGERVSGVLNQYAEMLAELKAKDPGFEAEMEPPMLVDEALETPADATVARVASHVLGALGLNSELSGVPYGSDASKLSRQGVPAIIFGPGSIDRAHAAVEYVECDQVQQALEFYRRFVMGFE